MEKNNLKNQKGVAIYLILVIMAIFLDISLGLSVVLFSEILNIREIGYSVVAFYAAESGIEEAFYWDLQECVTIGCETNVYCVHDGCKTGLENVSWNAQLGERGAEYAVSFNRGVGVKSMASSTGSFKNIKRAIRVDY
jgi:hypothetical protein